MGGKRKKKPAGHRGGGRTHAEAPTKPCKHCSKSIPIASKTCSSCGRSQAPPTASSLFCSMSCSDSGIPSPKRSKWVAGRSSGRRELSSYQQRGLPKAAQANGRGADTTRGAGGLPGQQRISGSQGATAAHQQPLQSQAPDLDRGRDQQDASTAASDSAGPSRSPSPGYDFGGIGGFDSGSEHGASPAAEQVPQAAPGTASAYSEADVIRYVNQLDGGLDGELGGELDGYIVVGSRERGGLPPRTAWLSF